MPGQARKVPEPRGVTIRRSLFRSVVLLNLFTCLAFLWITAHFRAREVQALSRSLIDQSMEVLAGEVARFFDPLTDGLLIARQWAMGGLFDPADATGANALFMPMLRRYRQISAVSTGDADGNNYFLYRDAEHWRNRIIRKVGHDQRIEHPLLDDTGTKLAEWAEKEGYDPRTRDWYKGATHRAAGVSPGVAGSDGGNGGWEPDVYWTEPYVFFSSQRPGMTAAVSVSVDGRKPYVLAMDVLFDDISHFTMDLSSSERGLVGGRGMAFVLTAAKRVVGLPRHERLADGQSWRESVFKTVDELGIETLSDALGELPEPELDQCRPFRFQSGEETWWAGVRPFPLGTERKLWLGVVVPETDVLQAVGRERGWFALVTLAALGAVSLLAVLLARDYSEPLKELLALSERMGKLDLGSRKRIVSSLKEINALADSQERMRAVLASFARYVPTDIVRELLRRGEAARIGGRTRTLTVIFTDIRGFTAIAESMTPTALTEHMAEYFQAMLDILLSEGATVDKFIGDAIVAFWGAPQPDEHHATHAVNAVLRCQERLDTLNQAWRKRELPPLPTRAGLATGPAVVGNVGAPSRLSYTALGDTVNLASRLEGLNRIYGTDVLVSAATFKNATGEAFLWRRVDRVAVKGKTESVEIYEPLGRRGQVAPEVTTFAASYEDALARYQERRFEEALKVLGDLERMRPDDLSVRRLLELCRQYQKNEPSSDWDGTTRLQFK